MKEMIGKKDRFWGRDVLFTTLMNSHKHKHIKQFLHTQVN